MGKKTYAKYITQNKFERIFFAEGGNKLEDNLYVNHNMVEVSTPMQFISIRLLPRRNMGVYKDGFVYMMETEVDDKFLSPKRTFIRFKVDEITAYKVDYSYYYDGGENDG